jgi:hypothetical protein
MNHRSMTKVGVNLLTARQERAITQILSSRSLEEARRSVKAAKGTFYGWLKDEIFQQALATQRRMLTEQAVERLRYALTEAADTLLVLLKDESPTVKLRAAHAILEHGVRAIEMQEFGQRLDELERRVQNVP